MGWSDDPELVATFRAEVEDRLASLRDGLLALEAVLADDRTQHFGRIAHRRHVRELATGRPAAREAITAR